MKVEIGPGKMPWVNRHPESGPWFFIEATDGDLKETISRLERPDFSLGGYGEGLESRFEMTPPQSADEILCVNLLGDWYTTARFQDLFGRGNFERYLKQLSCLCDGAYRVLQDKGRIVIAEITTPPPPDHILSQFFKSQFRQMRLLSASLYFYEAPFANANDSYAYEFRK